MPKFIYPSFTGTGANIGIGAVGDSCAVCNRPLQSCMCQLQVDGALWCLACIGNRAALPADVIETLQQMEREHGKR